MITASSCIAVRAEGRAGAAPRSRCVGRNLEELEHPAEQCTAVHGAVDPHAGRVELEGRRGAGAGQRVATLVRWQMVRRCPVARSRTLASLRLVDTQRTLPDSLRTRVK